MFYSRGESNVSCRPRDMAVDAHNIALFVRKRDIASVETGSTPYFKSLPPLSPLGQSFCDASSSSTATRRSGHPPPPSELADFGRSPATAVLPHPLRGTLLPLATGSSGSSGPSAASIEPPLREGFVLTSQSLRKGAASGVNVAAGQNPSLGRMYPQFCGNQRLHRPDYAFSAPPHLCPAGSLPRWRSFASPSWLRPCSAGRRPPPPQS
mmetsp:Transcript_29863/g.76586  ORF Transcript_29863/g.76586 Transcript_29863/m.76586 type:complete len:209 (-) Transcript_29863:376-1002(-)